MKHLLPMAIVLCLSPQADAALKIEGIRTASNNVLVAYFKTVCSSQASTAWPIAWRRSQGTWPVNAGIGSANAGVIVATSLPVLSSMMPPMLPPARRRAFSSDNALYRIPRPNPESSGRMAERLAF